MALFSRRAPALQRLQDHDWRSDAELAEITAELRQDRPRPQDAIPLSWHQDADVRRIGTELLLAKPSLALGIALVEAGLDRPVRDRRYAVQVVAQFPDALAGETVERLLDDKDSSKQRAGWELVLLLRAGTTRGRFLERAAREAPTGVRLAALKVLGESGASKGMVPLLLELATHEDWRLVQAAFEALAEVNDDRVLDVMLRTLSDGTAAIKPLAARYVQKVAMGEPKRVQRRALELLVSDDDATRRLAVEILLKTDATPAVLVKILAFSRGLLGWLRSRILYSLGAVGMPILDATAALLADPDDELRSSALVLAENLLENPDFDEESRRAAYRVLLGPVVKLLGDPDWWLAISACDILSRLKATRAVPALVHALQKEEVRWAAIEALGEIGDPAALRPVCSLLDDPRPEVRLEVVQALSRFRDRATFPLLQRLMTSDPSSAVRTGAADVLRTLTRELEGTELAVGATTGAVTMGAGDVPLHRILAWAREMNASDVHLTAEEAPLVRLHGELVRLEDHGVLSTATVRDLVLPHLNERQRKALRTNGECDFCLAVPEVGRYRGNAYVQRRGICANFRVIPNLPPTFEELRIPANLTSIVDYHQGLVVVSGPSGCGKSTTLAAMLDLLNRTRPVHIITLEDPIEFVHPTRTALVNQREVGADTVSFSKGLRQALREDPDVIMVGEMRDLETIRMALVAAETGHLVIATLHTPSAVQTIDRLVESFPYDERAQVRMTLSETLKFVVCQTLLPRIEGRGRVACFEVLKATHSIAHLIRENKTYQIHNQMQTGRSHGQQTRDQALMDLVNARIVRPEVAWARAEKPDAFEPLCPPEFLRQRDGGATS